MLIQLLLLLMLAWSIVLAIVVFSKWHSEREIENEPKGILSGTAERRQYRLNERIHQ